MLQKLSIRNFRLFEELDIEGFKRVNLIVGKNNTGKTTLLEAIRILEAKGNSTVVNHILKSRGQFTPSWDESYYALFSINNQSTRNSLLINELGISDFKYANEVKEPSPNLGFKVLYSGYGHLKSQLNSTDSPDFPHDNVVYVPIARDIDLLQKMWDNVSLTDLEEEVINIIRKTVEPQLDRLDVSGGVAKIKLTNQVKPIPIKAHGDGIQRMLSIALALVNSKGKLLLIDEFESGLHFSVQEVLWQIIFDYSQKWDIQVFATTQSDDALRTFFYVTSDEKKQDQGFLIRLQYSRKGKLEAVKYDRERLESALEMNFEIR
jgi:AAA15 family ATPase/GTPase